MSVLYYLLYIRREIRYFFSNRGGDELDNFSQEIKNN